MTSVIILDIIIIEANYPKFYKNASGILYNKFERNYNVYWVFPKAHNSHYNIISLEIKVTVTMYYRNLEVHCQAQTEASSRCWYLILMLI